MIPFNKPAVIGNEVKFINQAIANYSLCGDGYFSKLCQTWFETNTKCIKSLMTPSCTAALEMAAILIDIKAGDEVIMSSYTFVSTANAFALRGAKIVFVDIRPDTMNIDESKIEAAVTNKTVAIVPVHYAGVACEMDTIMNIANKYNLIVIEDAAQGMMSTYNNKALGTIGHIGTYSFHETKNYTSGGEGGLLLINDSKFISRAEIIREKGTNRSQFFRGMVDKYSWVDIGSSYLPSDIQAAYLWGQLQYADTINNQRLKSWNYYYDHLAMASDLFDVPYIPHNAKHNAHMFYIKVKDFETRTNLIAYLKNCGVSSAFHYIPLHSTNLGCELGSFIGVDEYTTDHSERLIRLPLFYLIDIDQQDKVIESVIKYFE